MSGLRRLALGGVLAWLLAAWLLAARPGHAQQVWFSPRGPEIGGSPDWDQLFKDTPAWSSVADRMNVYGFTAGYVLQTPDQALQAMAANLARHHVALALSAQSVAMTDADTCGHTEGYAPLAEAQRTVEKLVRLGIRLDILALDSPVWFGHYATGEQECGFTIDQVTDRVAAGARVYLDRFPNLVIGDVEPLPGTVRQFDWRPTYSAFLAGFATRTGHKLAFIQTDDDWHTPDIDRTIADFAVFAHAQGLKIGVIYDGDDYDKTDGAWVNSAIHRFTRLESIGGVVPDQANFASWNKRPTDILPETDAAAFSHMLEVYHRTRVQLTAERAGRQVLGRLLDAHGQPVPHAGLSVEVLGSEPARPPPVQTTAGTVPPKARFALLGMRVNMECNCGGANDLVVGDVTYSETGAPGSGQTYSVAQEALRRRGGLWDGVRVWPVATPQGVVARVVVPPSQRWGFNSDLFAVNPGAGFTFRVPIGAVGGGGLFGLAMVLWLDADHHGLYRDAITLVRDATEIATGSTDADGRFAIVLRDTAALGDRRLTVTAAATATTRGTILELR